MKLWEQRIVPAGLATAGLFFLIAAVRPAFAGASLNVAFFLVGLVCVVLAVVSWRATGRSR